MDRTLGEYRHTSVEGKGGVSEVANCDREGLDHLATPSRKITSGEKRFV
jgi:hypothetical protein